MADLSFVVYLDPDRTATLREIPKTESTSEVEQAPPPDAIVVHPGKRLDFLKQAVLGAGFRVEESLDEDGTARRLRRQLPDKRTVQAVKCLVPSDRARAFKEWAQNPETIKDGIRFYVPPATRKLLVKLGVEATGFYTNRLQQKREAPNVSKEGRLRRHNALYVYTTARKRGRVKTKAVVEVDATFQNLSETRLHVPGCGRVTAYSFEMPGINAESFMQFARNVLLLHGSDPRIRIAVRSPRALAHLNRFLDKLDNADAANLRAVLEVSKALPPDWKWQNGLPVPRQKDDATCLENGEKDDATCLETKRLEKEPSSSKAPDKTEVPASTPSPRLTPTDNEIVFTIFDGTASSIASTVRLRQLLLGFPNETAFAPTKVGDSSAAFICLARTDNEAVERMLSTTVALKDNGFRFIVNPEAEAWLDNLLNEFDENDVAVVREVWVRQT